MARTQFQTAFLLALMAGLTACDAGQTGSMKPKDMASTSPNPDSGTVKTESFFVRIVNHTTPALTSYLHKFNDFSKACEIMPSDSPTSMNCLLNMREFDLYANGLKWEINVPPSMCKYMVELPYYYYNRPTGILPTSITATFDTASVNVEPTLQSCTFDGVPVVPGAGGCVFGGGSGAEVTVTSDGQVRCGYDYTPGNVGPNCCEGSYAMSTSKTTRTWEDADEDGIQDASEVTVSTTVSTAETEYGGLRANCLAGPAMAEDWPKAKSGYPKSLVHKVELGFNKNYTVAAPLDIFGGSGNFYISNMYAWASYMAGTFSRATTKPKAIAPLVDFSGTNFSGYTTSDAYYYGCFDESAELKHEIRVFVNEWNTNDEFTLYSAASTRASADPNAAGTDGIDCAVGGAVADSACNDFKDWDDLMTAYPRE